MQYLKRLTSTPLGCVGSLNPLARWAENTVRNVQYIEDYSDYVVLKCSPLRMAPTSAQAGIYSAPTSACTVITPAIRGASAHWHSWARRCNQPLLQGQIWPCCAADTTPPMLSPAVGLPERRPRAAKQSITPLSPASFRSTHRVLNPASSPSDLLTLQVQLVSAPSCKLQNLEGRIITTNTQHCTP